MSSLVELVGFVPRSVLALLRTAFALALPSRIAAPSGQWGLHPGSPFEGYYTRIQTANRGTIAVILCRIDGAASRPFLLHLSYTPGPLESSDLRLHREFFPETIASEGGSGSFAIVFDGLGSMRYVEDASGEATTTYSVHDADSGLRFDCVVRGRTAWDASDARIGPERGLAHLGHLLGQHWFVHSTLSKASYTLSTPVKSIEGDGMAHLEKNYGFSFPSSWIWVQGFPSHSSSLGASVSTPRLSIAGGLVVPGVQGYLVGYRGRTISWDFAPPRTMILLGRLNFGTTVDVDSVGGRVRLVFSDWTRRLVIDVVAPCSTFIPLACPLPHGHTPDYAHESFAAVAVVKAYTRSGLWGVWTLREEATLDGAALEFGGGWSHRWIESRQKQT